MLPIPEQLRNVLASTELLQRLSGAGARAFTEQLECISLPSGSDLIPESSPGNGFYIVISGLLAATARNTRGEVRYLGTVAPGETAGGWFERTGGADSAEWRALQDTLLGQFSDAAFHSFTAQYPGDAAAIGDWVATRVRRTRLLLALELTDLFGELEPGALQALEKELDVVTFRGGEVVMRQGDPGDCLYVVINGLVRVLFESGAGEERVVSELGSGEVVGEMALLNNSPRTATVHAIRDTLAARLSRNSFEQFVAAHPHAALKIFTRKLVVRLGEQLSGAVSATQSIRTLAVLGLTPEFALEPFTARLGSALSALGSTLHLNSGRVDLALGKSGAAQSPESGPENLRIVEWLNGQELQHRFVVYECDSAPTVWTRRCLRQADHILLVAPAGADPSQGTAEKELLAPIMTAASLILLYPHGAPPPSGTAAWLEARKVQRHFHVRAESPADFQRVARFLTGRAFGLTLGGGFARGLVHIGVIRAVAEAGIAIDAIGGNSMGAVIAAQFAQGWDRDKMLRETAKGCAACISDMTLPFIAFKSGGRFSTLIRQFNGETRIEDLWIPYFCVSANLNRAELQIHKQGSLTKAILASSRVPGVFPPVIYDGEMHIDGGILNNVPVDVMRAFTSNGIVMGVDAVPNRQFSALPDYGLDLPGWRALWGRINPFSRRSAGLPSIVQIMLRTMEFGSVYRKRSLTASADLFLRPPLHKFKPTDFAAADEIVEIGYSTARSAIDEWLKNADMPRKPIRERAVL